jgi:hypothetical protein
MTRLSCFAVFCAVASIASCAGSNDGAPAASAAPTVTFTTQPYTLKPGDEKYYCYTMDLPEDRETVVRKITPTYGKATHHFGLYYTLAPEPKGFSECPLLIKETWIPLYGGGVDSGNLELPQGAGFRLAKGQQLLIQLHLLNAGTSDVTDTGTMTLETLDPTTKITPAGMFGFDNRDLALPAKSAAVEAEMSCPAPFDMDVFGVFGHMHTLGKHIEVSRGATPGAEVLYSTPWIFDQQPTTPVALKIKKGDQLHIKCRWDNTLDKVVTYGESTGDEMCSFVFYYTPYARLDGCLKTPPKAQ